MREEKRSIVNSRERVTERKGEQIRQQHYHSAPLFKHHKKTLSSGCSHWLHLWPITARQRKVPLGYTQPQNMRERQREACCSAEVPSVRRASISLVFLYWSEYITMNKLQASLQ